MILYQNMHSSQYQVYDDAILELGYPPISILKSFINGSKSVSAVADYYTVNGNHVDLDYSYKIDLRDIQYAYGKAASLARKKRYLYYFGGIIMCDYYGNIKREVSSCYRLTAGKKLISVTDEEIPISIKVLRYCLRTTLPVINAGVILQYLSEHSKTLVKDERKLIRLGFARVGASVFVAAQQMGGKDDLIFVVNLIRGKSLLLLTMKQEDIKGLLQFRQRQGVSNA